MERKMHRGTAEDNGILIKLVLQQNIRKEKLYQISRLKCKPSACIGEKFLSQDTRDTNALEKHVPEMRAKVLNIALPCTSIDANRVTDVQRAESAL